MAQPLQDFAPADFTYTALVTLLWQLYERAHELGRTTLGNDLLVASNELQGGPWTHSGNAPGRLSLPFTAACLLVDHLLDELQATSPGLAARAAIGATREILDGSQPRKP